MMKARITTALMVAFLVGGALIKPTFGQQSTKNTDAQDQTNQMNGNSMNKMKDDKMSDNKMQDDKMNQNMSSGKKHRKHKKVKSKPADKM